MNSKTAEWFASIDFGSGNILISQEMILDSFYTRNIGEHIPPSVLSKLKEIDLDAKLKETNQEHSENKAKDVTTIYIGGETPFLIKTSSIPQMKKLILEECSTLGGVIGNYLKNNGIVAFHFEENKIEYILDVSFLAKKIKS